MVICFLWVTWSWCIIPYLLSGNIFDLFCSYFCYVPKTKCLFHPVYSAVFVNYMIISALARCQLQLHRVGDLAYRVWLVLLCCCSRAERAAAWRTAESYNRTINTVPPCLVLSPATAQDDNVGLANGYVWVLFHCACTMLFCLTSPLVTPTLGLYLVFKHAVDTQNIRTVYTAKERQPVLLRTAVQILVAIPLFAQASVALYHIINNLRRWMERDPRERWEDSELALWSGQLLILNGLVLLLASSSGWRLPVSLFGRRGGGRAGGPAGRGGPVIWRYRDPLLDTDPGRGSSSGAGHQ